MGIVLAWLLSPREFGLIGMIMIFITISQSLINSGFSSALIRKKDCTQADYSTVFFYNLAVGIGFFFALNCFAPAISRFFREPDLKPILNVLSIVLIIDSLTLIQVTILIKRIHFKLQTRISLIASLASGLTAIAMAYAGFGVWSLVSQLICRQVFNSFFLWIWNQWKPSLIFSKRSFKELFGFGSKILLSGLIDTAYQNVFYLVIGKLYSARELGFYARADAFKNMASTNLHNIIARVSYPALSSIQDDIPRLRANYQRLIRSTMFITFNLMLGMAGLAEAMTITLIGEKWRPSIIYLQMLCFVGMMYPLHALNLNMLQVQGRSDLFLKLEIIKKVLAVPVIIIGVFWGIKAMIVGMMVNALIAYYLNSYWSGRMIGYSFKEQLKDVAPSFFLALLMGGFVFAVGYFLPCSYFIKAIVQLISGTVFVILACELLQLREYHYIKSLILDSIKVNRNG